MEGSVQPVSVPSGWRATIRVRDAEGAVLGERELSTEGDDCSKLTEPLALVIALMIDPDSNTTVSFDEPKLPSPPPPSPQVEVHRETVYVPMPVEAPPEERWVFEGGAGLVSGAGHLPTPNIGGMASALLRPKGFWTLEAHGAAWWRSRAEEQGVAVDLGRWEGGLGLCPFSGFEDAGSYALCAGGQLALLTSHQSASDEETAPEVVPEVAAAFRGSLVLYEPFVLRLGLSAFVPLRRPQVLADEPSGIEVFRSYWIGGAADFGLGLRLR